MASVSLIGGNGSGPTAGTVVACKAASGLIFLIYAGVLTGFVASAGDQDTPYSSSICGYTFGTYTDYRTSSVFDARTQFSEGAGLYKQPLGYADEGSLVSMFNVLWILVAALYFSALWLCCLPAAVYFLTPAEQRETARYYTTIELDFNWYRWIHWTVTHPLIFVSVAIVAGIANVWVITLFSFVVVAWMINLAYTEAASKVPESRLAEVRSGRVNVPSTVWEPFACAAVLFIVTAVVVFAYVATTISDAGIGIAAETSAEAARTVSLVLATSITAYVVYFCVWLLCGIGAHTYLGWCGPARSKELWYECIYFVFLTAITWIIAGLAFANCADDSVPAP